MRNDRMEHVIARKRFIDMNWIYVTGHHGKDSMSCLVSVRHRLTNPDPDFVECPILDV